MSQTLPALNQGLAKCLKVGVRLCLLIFTVGLLFHSPVLITLGLFVLMGLPTLQVGLALYFFIKQKEGIFATVAALVFTVLVVSFF